MFWADMVAWIAFLLLINFATKRRYLSPRANPVLSRSLVYSLVGIAVFTSIYGAFVTWHSLVLWPRVLAAMRGEAPTGLALHERILANLGELRTGTLVAVYVVVCTAIYVAITFWMDRRRKGRDGARISHRDASPACGEGPE